MKMAVKSQETALVALAAVLAKEISPGTTIVTDSVTSDHLSEFLTQRLGLSHLRYKRGYKNVINKAIELNAGGTDCQLAIETSGHAAFKENYFLDDGAYLAAKIVIKAARLLREGKSLSNVISDLKEPQEAIEVRLPVTASNFTAYGSQVIKELEAWVQSQVTENTDGKTVMQLGSAQLRRRAHQLFRKQQRIIKQHAPIRLVPASYGRCTIP